MANGALTAQGPTEASRVKAAGWEAERFSQDVLKRARRWAGVVVEPVPGTFPRRNRWRLSVQPEGAKGGPGR